MSQHARHVFEELRVFGAVLGIVRHIGGEVVNLPMAGDGDVQRVQFAIDHHHAVLADFAIRPAGVEVTENGQILAREFGQRRGQLRDSLDAQESDARYGSRESG